MDEKSRTPCTHNVLRLQARAEPNPLIVLPVAAGVHDDSAWMAGSPGSAAAGTCGSPANSGEC
eukprot:scaffold2846_cov125-Isochrysis_galbana.AAC.10